MTNANPAAANVTLTAWVIRDQDKQHGTTYVSSWHLSGDMDIAEAGWTKAQGLAMRFDSRNLALLLSACVGGRVVRLRAKAA